MCVALVKRDLVDEITPDQCDAHSCQKKLAPKLRYSQAELNEHPGYERYEAKGRNSGNSRNGKRKRQLETSAGSQAIEVPRDRNGSFESPLLDGKRSKERERKITSLYAKGTSTRDIQGMIAEIYSVEVTAATVSTITDKLLPLVEEWQNRPLQLLYSIIYRDALYLKLRRDGKIENVAIYIVLAVDVDGHNDVLGNWVGDGAEGANFWLNVLSDLQTRGVEDILIACVNGLTGFSDAIGAIFPKAIVQRCIIHQIRPTRHRHAKRQKPICSSSRKLGGANIHTKTKGVFPTNKLIRKLLYLVHRNIEKKWTMPIRAWAKIRNQLAIRFEGRFPL